MLPFLRRGRLVPHRRRFHDRKLGIETLEIRAVLSASPISPPPTVHFEVDPGEYEADTLLVRLRDEQSFAAEQLSDANQQSIIAATRMGPTLGLAEHWHKVELPPGMALDSALAAYRAHPQVLYAEPNYILHVAQLPNDPQLADMWDLENTGQTGGTPDADLDASWAWDVNTGSGNTVVAVIDTGIDYNHPDLAQNIWVNAGEIAGDGIDNDNNGYVDDVHGYDFINHDPDPLDDQGHGTHVAGTIGAVGDNGLGVTGINWHVQLMALKFLGADGSGTTADAIEAIYYARDNGADVINASWGGDPYSQALYDAIAATRDADQIFVAAAGNGNAFGIGVNNDTTPFYPSGYDLDNILAVAATDHNDNLATFSNYGATTVDLAAPGVNILSTTVGSGYGYNSGTSMAAPHVAGVAALVRDLHPGWTADQVIQQILDTVDPLPGLQGYVASGGRVNAAAALGNPEPPPPPPPPATLPMFEDFNDDQSGSFVPQTGNWSAESRRYTTTPATQDHDFVAVSTLSLGDPLPSNVEIRAVMEAEPGQISLFGVLLSDHLTDGLLVYDYISPDDFKFAGADIDGGRWVIGHRDAGGWNIDAQAADSLQANVRYEMRVLIENDADVTLIADGEEKLTIQYAAPVTTGAVGLAAKDSTTHFDDVLVQEYVAPTPTTLPAAEDFSDGLAENLGPQLGVWYVDQGRYETIPGQDQDGISTWRISDPLPSDVQLAAVINADDVTSGRLSNAFVIFDYQGPQDFKFAGAYVGVDRWLMGRRTASGWQEDATLNETIDAATDYGLQVRLEGDTATLLVDGVAKLTHTFGDALADGDVGVGTRNALARFDDLGVSEYVAPPPPPLTTLPVSEDFDDGAADFFEVRDGTWWVDSGRYRVVPLLDQDGVSTLRIVDPLPSDLEILATINADDLTANRFSNGFVVFDYHSPTDFKFAGAYVASNRWLIGRRTESGWLEDATFDESINAWTDYALQVRLEGDTVTLWANGVQKLSHTFGDTLNDGEVGLGTRDALSYFDDVQVYEYVPPPPPPSTTLPVSEDFQDGAADFFEVQSGTWTVQSGGYRVVPQVDQDGVSTLRISDPLPSELQFLATINGDDVSSGRLSNAFVIFDYQGPLDFKFAGAYIGADRWLMGRRTSGGWQEDATLNETIDASTDYALEVRLEGDTATLIVDGQTKLLHTFGDVLSDGDVGVGTRNALAGFDDIQVQAYVPPPSAALPVSEDFEDGSADFFDVRTGDWTVESGHYRVVPTLDQDGVSTLRIAEPLPSELDIRATINADDLTPNRFSNGFVIFDYQGPTDFKFAGAYVASDMWLIGRRTSSGWITDIAVTEAISPWTDYNLQVILEDTQVRLIVDGTEKLSGQYSDLLTDGAVGVGTRDALCNFDNVQVQAYAPLVLSAAGLTTDSAPAPSSETSGSAADIAVALAHAEVDRAFADLGGNVGSRSDVFALLPDPLLLSPRRPSTAPSAAPWSPLTLPQDGRWLAPLVDEALADFVEDLLDTAASNGRPPWDL